MLNGCSSTDLPDGMTDGGKSISTSSACVKCHGSIENAAPPLSVSGAFDTSDVTVGAHQTHLQNGEIRKALSCDNCHIVPESSDQDGHMDESPAEITWGTLSVTENANPSWDRINERCSNVYCHGATLSGGTNKTPVWTVVDGSQVSCGTCHGNPPPSHPSQTQCNLCHSDTVNADGGINVDGNFHIDGIVQVDDTFEAVHPEGFDSPDKHGYAFYDDKESCKDCHGEKYTGGLSGISCDDCHNSQNWRTDCTFCHGGTDNSSGAPPAGVRDEDSTSMLAVGAHTIHLEDQGLSSGLCGLCHIKMDCSFCHIKPTSFKDEGHIDGLPGAEVHISSATGSKARYDSATGTCSAVGCHFGKTVSWKSPEDADPKSLNKTHDQDGFDSLLEQWFGGIGKK